MLNFDFLEKGLGIVSPTHFMNGSFKENVCHFIICQLTKVHCLIAFISWDIGKYVYCKCFFSRLWQHKFWNWAYLSNQAIFLHGQKVKGKKLNILRTKRPFNPIHAGPFWISSRMGRGKKVPSLKSVTRPIKVKLGTVIPYLKKIQKIFESHDTTLCSADISFLSSEISNFCYQEILI